MDFHQAYCLNFLVLARYLSRGTFSTIAALLLSVLAITLTASAAWLLGELLARGPGSVDLAGLGVFDFWVAFVATVANYLRFFRFCPGFARSSAPTASVPDGRSGSAAFAVTAIVGPLAVILIIALLSER